MEIDYPEKLCNISDAVLAIPFVCNVLPIIWLMNAELVVAELDKDFYDSIEKIKWGYINMYPAAMWRGKLKVESLVQYYMPNSTTNSIVFFSGGLDAVTTLYRHIDENPKLLSVWGADVEFDNKEGWSKIQQIIDDQAKRYNLDHINVRSSFRKFDNEFNLEKDLCKPLKDGWWHGVKHGIGLIGHAAPIACLYNVKHIYIASSNCPEDGIVTCASHPTIDNNIRFCGAQIIHDGFEMSRQKKVQYIVGKRKETKEDEIPLHVCWQSKTGNNCCRCEKCYRSMLAIWIEGDDPQKYGFDITTECFREIYREMALKYEYSKVIAIQWTQLQKGMRANQLMLKEKNYYKDIKWVLEYDFNHPNRFIKRVIYKLTHFSELRKMLSEMNWYCFLSSIKQKIRK